MSTSPRPEGDPDEGPSDDLDSRFAAIVEGLELEPQPSPPDEVSPGPGPGSFEELRAWTDVNPALLAGSGTDDTDSDDSDDDHYEPPPPPPLPRADTVTRWAWAGAVGCPTAYVVGALLGMDLGGPVGVALIGGFAAGFVTLVARMKDGPRSDDDPDDGAVV